MKLNCVDSIFFDLDGTLWDCYEVLKKFWKINHGIDFKKSYLGMDLQEMSQAIGLSQETIQSTQEKENQFISKESPKIYDGVVYGIQELSQNYKLFIVSNCQKGYIDVFLQKTGLSGFITDFKYSENSKSKNIQDLIDKYKLKNPIMLGDTKSDLNAANDNNITFIQAEYGFGKFFHKYRVSSFRNFLKTVEDKKL